MKTQNHHIQSNHAFLRKLSEKVFAFRGSNHNIKSPKFKNDEYPELLLFLEKGLKETPFLLLAFFIMLFLNATSASAQFSIEGQLVQRGEYRHGYGKLISENEDPAVFIGQRTRLQANYNLEKFKLYMSVQDVRTWGNTPQIKATDPFLSVHEAWAETWLDSHWSIKLGRQELNYDNARFLGNLDWALQARAHDFALIKFEKNKMQLHFGAGYNQDAEKLSGNIFTLANQYKTAQFVRYENTIANFNFAVMFWNNGRQFAKTDSAKNTTESSIRFTQTIGLPTLKYQFQNTVISGFYYHQFGRDLSNRNVNAFDASAQVSHLINFNKEKGQSLRLTAGGEVLSGNKQNGSESNTNASFSPMYGTNHMHNGYMDLFFVGGRHENSVGLADIFFKMKYDFNPKFFTSLNTHSFRTYADVYSNGNSNNKMDKNLGTGLDLTLGYIMHQAVSVQAGYSQVFVSNTLSYLQKTYNPDATQNWAYLMMIYRPKSAKKFIGLAF